MDEFLSAGMQCYGEATTVMVDFGREIETRLQNILSSRMAGKCGRFVKTAEAKVKSSRTWKEYPHLSAWVDGTAKGGAKVVITIGINWYESETEYPFYEIRLEPNESYLERMKEFKWEQKVCQFSSQDRNCIRLDPDKDEFDLEHDFGILFDELVRFFEDSVGEFDKVTGVGE
jgi:hypothetical protein